ncbi:hypothetical protein NA57DRAFT_55457 [Rhizodiscina lignyota]|uniref:Uncharacterized protein n=1 Tax=Rhizodiscina lignyota TaxID=1504668 RepID=A0A9P4M688_9PEZI|nr:hypothetical protein NA57DRAFT_55457 [Rhizodiscina lignyota]
MNACPPTRSSSSSCLYAERAAPSRRDSKGFEAFDSSDSMELRTGAGWLSSIYSNQDRNLTDSATRLDARSDWARAQLIHKPVRVRSGRETTYARVSICFTAAVTVSPPKGPNCYCEYIRIQLFPLLRRLSRRLLKPLSPSPPTLSSTADARILKTCPAGDAPEDPQDGGMSIGMFIQANHLI